MIPTLGIWLLSLAGATMAQQTQLPARNDEKLPARNYKKLLKELELAREQKEKFMDALELMLEESVRQEYGTGHNVESRMYFSGKTEGINEVYRFLRGEK